MYLFFESSEKHFDLVMSKNIFCSKINLKKLCYAGSAPLSPLSSWGAWLPHQARTLCRAFSSKQPQKKD